jgi:hypothetical protein
MPASFVLLVLENSTRTAGFRQAAGQNERGMKGDRFANASLQMRLSAENRPVFSAWTRSQAWKNACSVASESQERGKQVARQADIEAVTHG